YGRKRFSPVRYKFPLKYYTAVVDLGQRDGSMKYFLNTIVDSRFHEILHHSRWLDSSPLEIINNSDGKIANHHE
ncbi:MAG: hypothetical protein ABJK46_17835, partial [Ekhidna sp.]